MRYWTKELWAVRDDERVIVGALIIVLPMKDNTSLITPTIAVRPDARRRGYGAALARTVEERAAHFGRTVVQSQLNVPLDGSGTPAQAFARGYGLQPANVEVHRILELPLDEAFLDGLAAEAAEKHGGVRADHLAGPLPG